MDESSFPHAPVSKAKLDLLLVGEALIGDLGVGGVSLRKITQQAGHKNVYAAQYHFGTRDNLIQSIMLYRRAEMDRLRHQLFASRRKKARDASSAFIIEALMRPLLQQRSADGKRSFCRFQRSLMQVADFSRFWENAAEVAPFTDLLYDILRQRLSHLPDPIWLLRRNGTAKYGVNLIADFDKGWISSDISEEELLADLVNTMSAALEAPLASAAQ